ncbi:molybdopterin converting factor subunit 1 [Undibacterium curvum]|uniref:Molybdopterin converting factor subunit 1 n=1 Tax=Undibacterium curvum TaxID=2762294 RepID=A0ABR6ZZM7_9BURK|nr:molybdopterin converting factor subunit 1 [Undibacterium curvum]MBC3930123.1 molybdopterin converting factor subunit 1 [Undibacterium curvum]
MKIQCRFFASVREALGASFEEIELPPEVTTVAAVRAYLRQRGGVWDEVLSDKNLLRTAYNQQMCAADTVLTEQCEVAFFPPVTGG